MASDSTPSTTMLRDLQHPVWDVYDLSCTARLNERYLACRIDSLKKRNFVIEFIIAATASGSAVTGLAFWDSAYGRIVWQSLVTIAAVAAVIKPLLQLQPEIDRLQSLAAGWRMVAFELKSIEITCRQENAYGPTLQQRFADVLGMVRKINEQETAEKTDEKLRDKCAAEVLRQYPPENFPVPPRLALPESDPIRPISGVK